MTPAMYFDNLILDPVDFQAQVSHKSHRVRRLNNRAVHKGARRIAKTNKGNRPIDFKPVARQTRVTIDLRNLPDEISEQEHMNILSAIGHNVSPADIKWARKVCRLAFENCRNDEDRLRDNLDMEWFYAETPEREIALVTFVSQTKWHTTKDGITMYGATDIDCYSAIEGKEYLPLFKEGKIGLEFDATKEEVAK